MGLDINIVKSDDWEHCDFEDWDKYDDIPKTPSKKYPEHLFRIGYIRSSYNEAGINHYLADRGLPTLYDIFDKDNQKSYFVKVDWNAALAKAKGLLDAYRAQMARPAGKFEVISVSLMVDFAHEVRK